MTITSIRVAAAALLSSIALLGGCGGGGDTQVDGGGGGGAGGPVPASATASPEAYSAYVGSLEPDERAEPKSLQQVEPPRSETAEPIDVS